MAQLTQAQWEKKLRSWVPSWIFERDVNARAYFKALAKVLSELEDQLAEHIAETFITTATGDALNLHGAERGIPRLPDELDPYYSLRIRTIVNNSNIPAIKKIVNSLLTVGECEILEDYEAGIFCDRGNFLDRKELWLEHLVKDAFTVIILNQRPGARAFLDRAFFMNRDAFVTELTDSFDTMNAIREAVDFARAAGCLFRIVQLKGSE